MRCVALCISELQHLTHLTSKSQKIIPVASDVLLTVVTLWESALDHVSPPLPLSLVRSAFVDNWIKILHK